MLSEKKLKILNDFIDSSENPDLNVYLNTIKPILNDIEDEKLFLKIVDKTLKNLDILIGIHEEDSSYVGLGLTLAGLSNVWIYSVDKTDYNIYKQQLRLKKINKITK